MNITATFKHALVSLLRRPAMPAVVVAMLGLGIASVTVMYALFDALLLRGLPYHEPDRLVSVWGRPADPSLGGSPDSKWWTSYPDLEDFRRRQSHFEDLAGYQDHLVVVRTGNMPPRRVKAGRANAELFGLLGVGPEHGRLFTPEEDRLGAEPVVVLDAGFATELGLAVADLGNAVIQLNEVSHRVIGILPSSFDLPRGAKFWTPLAQNMGQDNRGMHRMLVLGRLAPGSTIAEAQGDLTAIAGRLAEAYPESNRNRSLWLEPLRESLVGGYRGVVSLLLAACGLLLLVVAVNIAGLLLVRALARRRELAIHRALGATRRRLVARLMAEALLLGLAGAAVGLTVAWAALESAPAWLPADLPFSGRIRINPGVFGFALLVGAVSAVAFGLMPALRSARGTGAADLKAGTAQAGRGRGQSGLGGSLLVVQVALAFALVAGAALLTRTAYGLMTEPLGFQSEGRLAFRLFLPAESYETMNEPGRVNAYYRELVERVAAVPGVTGTSTSSGGHPLEPSWNTEYWIAGRDAPASGVLPEARFRPVGPDYFKTLGIPLLSGRGISERDGFEAPGVVVINRAFARLHFEDRDPLGQFLTKNSWWEQRRTPGEEFQLWRIVGVVGNVLFDGPGSKPAPAMYFSQAQWPQEDRFLIVDTDGNAAAVVRPIQEIIWSLDDAVPADAITFLENARAGLLRDRLLATALIAAFAGVVLGLAVAGLYALLAFAVTMERRHIGIRLAVGARSASILRAYLQRGVWLASAGIAFGIALFLAARVLVGALTELLGPLSPTALALSGAVFITVALLGALVPALRAARLAPMEVLRDE